MCPFLHTYINGKAYCVSQCLNVSAIKETIKADWFERSKLNQNVKVRGCSVDTLEYQCHRHPYCCFQTEFNTIHLLVRKKNHVFPYRGKRTMNKWMSFVIWKPQLNISHEMSHRALCHHWGVCGDGEVMHLWSGFFTLHSLLPSPQTFQRWTYVPWSRKSDLKFTP